MNEDAFPEQPEDASPMDDEGDILELGGPEGDDSFDPAPTAEPSDKTPAAGTVAPPPDGPPGPPPPTGPPKQRIPTKSFLEKVASLGICLWGLISLAALGGAVYFLVTFLMKFEAI